jgi:hypothetical protein
MMNKRPSVYMIANIGSLIAVFIGVLNLITYREIWIFAVVMAILIVLSVYAVKERRKLQKRQRP